MRWPPLTSTLLATAFVALGACGDAATNGVQDTTIAQDTAPDVPASASVLVVDPAAINFGTAALNDGPIKDLELENTGADPIVITDIGFVTAAGFFAANLPRATIAVGETLVLKITFFALSEGTHSDTLRLTTNAANGPTIDVAVTGAVGGAVCLDSDGDGRGAGCSAGTDCNENNDQIYQGAPERCNADDDDCDGLFDEDFVGLGTACTAGIGECAVTGINVCNDAQDGIQCSTEALVGDLELCNGEDDDCDGVTDEDFPSKGELCDVGLGACRVVDKWACAEDGRSLVCPASSNPQTVELCDDNIDNDCDGVTDEGQIEACADQVDNDCDGITDESGSRWGEVFFARDSFDETVAIYTSQGDGSFQSPIELDFPGDNRHSVHAVGDFDGDQWLDLIVLETATEGRTTCATTNQCANGQTCASGICRELCSIGSACTQFQGERCVDTLSHNIANDTMCLPPQRVLLAVSSCVGVDTIALTELFTVPAGDQLGPVLDADGNGHLDFVGLEYFKDAKRGYVWLNDGDGGFTQTPIADRFKYDLLFGPGSIGHWQYGLTRTSKDLTGDGIVDILGQSQATTGSQPTDYWLIRGKGDGNFEDVVPLGATIPVPANLSTVDDFDGDGDQDIIGGLDEDGVPGGAWVVQNQSGPMALAWSEPHQIFDLTPLYPTGNEKPGLGSGTSFDFDGDDQPDVLAVWTPQECGSFIWGCTDIQNSADTCFGGNCRRVAFIKNRTLDPCDAGTSCDASGQCVGGCTADCTDRVCGSDGCGGSCGSCADGQLCVDGQCTVDCTPDCSGKQCGGNGCGGSCGACPTGFLCVDGGCTDNCTPSCDGKRCGGDGCGGSCAVFDEPQQVAFDKNPRTNLEAPTNVPPTVPEIRITPASPGDDDTLTCAVETPSFDLDPVRYVYRWERNGVFAKDVGQRPTVFGDLTAPNETWTCIVQATDGIEFSRRVSAQVTVSP